MPINTSRHTYDLVKYLQKEIKANKYKDGAFLPPIRQLSEEHHISFETVRRGLKELEKNGFLFAVPRKGYRVIYNPHAQEKSSPFVFFTKGISPQIKISHQISDAIEHNASKRNWSILKIILNTHVKEKENINDVIDQIKQANAWGIIVDSISPETIKELKPLHLPIIVINHWNENLNIDTVIQDNYQGGYLAANWLASKTKGSIFWPAFNQNKESTPIRERYAGATSSLMSLNRKFRHQVYDDFKNKDIKELIYWILKHYKKPGLLAFTIGEAKFIKEVADQLKLKIGKDFFMTGWTSSSYYKTEYLPMFTSKFTPPTIIWDVESMAENTLEMLDRRRLGWTGKPVRLCISSELKIYNK